MSNRIQVIDDFLTLHELEMCIKAVSRSEWSFGQFSDLSPIATPFWMLTLTNDPFFNTHLFSKIEQASNKKFTLQRVYANGQTFGQDGTYHPDCDIPGCYTCCIYINTQITPETADNIGGEFVFKLPLKNNESLVETEKENPFSRIMILPLYNRAIMFPSEYFHKGLSFNRYNRGLRLSIVWKLQLK